MMICDKQNNQNVVAKRKEKERGVQHAQEQGVKISKVQKEYEKRMKTFCQDVTLVTLDTRNATRQTQNFYGSDVRARGRLRDARNQVPARAANAAIKAPRGRCKSA